MASTLGSNSQAPRTGSTGHFMPTPLKASLALEQTGHAHNPWHLALWP